MSADGLICGTDLNYFYHGHLEPSFRLSLSRSLSPSLSLFTVLMIILLFGSSVLFIIGLEPLVIEGKLGGNDGEVRTNIDEMKSVVKVYGASNILCILTTTSCFAPRVPDSLEAVSKLCLEENLFHVVNNAYGLQNSGCVHQILRGSE